MSYSYDRDDNVSASNLEQPIVDVLGDLKERTDSSLVENEQVKGEHVNFEYKSLVYSTKTITSNFIFSFSYEDMVDEGIRNNKLLKKIFSVKGSSFDYLKRLNKQLNWKVLSVVAWCPWALLSFTEMLTRLSTNWGTSINFLFFGKSLVLIGLAWFVYLFCKNLMLSRPFLYYSAIGNENNDFYKYVESYFLSNYKENISSKDTDEAAFSVATILVESKYINGDIYTYQKNLQEKFGSNYSHRVLLREIIREHLVDFKGTEFWSEDLDYFYRSFLAYKFVDTEEEVLKRKKKILSSVE